MCQNYSCHDRAVSVQHKKVNIYIRIAAVGRQASAASIYHPSGAGGTVLLRQGYGRTSCAALQPRRYHQRNWLRTA